MKSFFKWKRFYCTLWLQVHTTVCKNKTFTAKRVEACLSLVYMASADEFLTIEVASSVMGWLWACFSQHICLLKFLAKTKHRQSGSTKIISWSYVDKWYTRFHTFDLSFFIQIACFLRFHEFFPYEMCEIFILSRNVFQWYSSPIWNRDEIEIPWKW